MLKDKEKGWWESPAGLKWLCPTCGIVSNIEDWEEVIIYCEDCGDHDGRKCPNCLAEFDHVWGSREIKSGDALI